MINVMEYELALLKREWAIMKGSQQILKSNCYDVKDKIEELLEEKLGFFTMIEINPDEDEILFFPHSDNEEDLEDEQLIQLEELGINHFFEESTTECIYNLLGIKVVEIKN